MVTLDVAQPSAPAFTAAVGGALEDFLASRRTQLLAIDPSLEAMADRAQLFLRGGKRLRPAFCAWGHAAVSGSLDLPDAVVRAAASLDVLHVSALMHDDVMDASDTRRGVPSAHRQFEADHRAEDSRGDAEAFGRAAAILLGDLLLVWSVEMLETAGLASDALERARPWVQAVRTEVTAGQFLDVRAQASDPLAQTRTAAGADALAALVSHVVTYKTSRYTVERPLNIGAALAGASAEQQHILNAFGLPLGRAFQYRDDLLGVFGDEALTGKESGEDLREGKLTLLVVETLRHASEADAVRFAGLLGDPHLDARGVARAREISEASGARRLVESAIDRELDAALAALATADLHPAGVAGLTALAEAAVKRSF